MDYKQFSGTLVIRSACGSPIKMDDPNYLKWLAAGNCPFPPDPPVGNELAAMLAVKEAEAKVAVTSEMVSEMTGQVDEVVEELQ